MISFRAVLVLSLLSCAAFAAGRSLTIQDLKQTAARTQSEQVLAVVDGEEIRAADVLPVLFLTHTELMYAALEQAVRRRLMIKEVERLGVEIGESVLDRNVAEVLKKQAEEFELAAGPGSDFEQYILRRYGTTSDAYRKAVRGQVMEELFLTRLIRYEARTLERMQVRVIVVDEFDLAKEIIEKLDEGANFTALARSHSIDKSAADGGLFPPVARDCPHPLLDQAATLQPGERAELSTVEQGKTRLFRILRLERLIPADRRPYSEQAPEIEELLMTESIDPFEMLEWDRRTRDRYPIDVRMGRA